MPRNAFFYKHFLVKINVIKKCQANVENAWGN